MATSFTVNADDLAYILKQITVAELDSQPGVTLLDAIMQVYGVTARDAALLPAGLRTVSGADNNLLSGQEQFGAADNTFPRLLDPIFGNEQDEPAFAGVTNTDYAQPGDVVDSDPRIISNLIADQTAANPAAVRLALTLAGITGAAATTAATAIDTAYRATLVSDPVAAAAARDALTSLLDSFGIEQGPEGGLTLPNLSPDIGLSPPFNAWMTFFGQFFDHGLDLVTKGGNGTVYIPLQVDDPLVAGADHIFGTADDLPPQLRFMALTRATPVVDSNGVVQHTNTTTSFIDQNQTYTSHPSHQVFLREYARIDLGDGAGPVTRSTGHLLDGSAATGSHAGAIGNWAEVKAQALTMLGIRLTDADVGNVPLLLTDPYGNFIPGANGYAQMVMKADAAHGNQPWLLEGTADGITTEGAELTGHAFLNDIAHHAAPGLVDSNHNGVQDPGEASLIADADIDVDGDGVYDAGVDTLTDVNGDGVISTADFFADDHLGTTYDDEMLNAHFVTGDGRGNENIALTTVHSIFHSEHNRIVEANKATILATGDRTFINEWLLVDLGPTDAIPTDPSALTWDGARLFQAGRFVTEMQYQHLVFEEFARTIQPNVDPFVFTNSAEVDASIVAEFAHVVYRFGHSMLTDTVDRLDNNLAPVDGGSQETLIAAFLNPQMYVASGDDLATTNANIIRGLTRDVGNEIDEFVVPALQSNLLGLPLDLPALNIARGRDAGVPSLNEARSQLYADFGLVDLKPYTSWADFAQHLKNPLSIINFIAAYGTHESITTATTLEAKRDAAMLLVLGNVDVTGDGIAETAPSDRIDFLNARGAHAGGSLGGLNAVDLWIGGLAEEKNEFGGMLGSTFNFVFEYQMEQLQNGDRLYYLSRTQGLNLLNQLEPNTFTDLVMRNTDLGGVYSTHLNGSLFFTPDHVIELDRGIAQQGADPVYDDPVQQAIDPKVFRDYSGGTTTIDATTGITHDVGAYLRVSGGEHYVLGGTEGNDTILGDKGIDTLWGDGGNDYLNAGMESDNVFGGEGDDIIEDPFGDDVLRGNQGNDVINGGSGIDLLFGDSGNDFLTNTTDTAEMFAGEGNDFLLGGSAPDALLGNEGDDWLEGGEGFDSLSGENSQLFFNSTIIGHDILWGQANDTDYDGESGDDIMVQGAGIQRNNGMLGFDWVIQKGDSVAGDIDLGISRFFAQPSFTLRDRSDSVEAASGWRLDDRLIGTNTPTGAVGPGGGGILGGPPTDSMLLSQNVALISGLEQLVQLTPGALRGQTVGADGVAFADLALDTTVFDPTLGGDILIGGAGSDTIYGKAGNDIIDGDRWLNIRIEVHQETDGTGPLVTNLASVGADGSVDSLNEIRADLLSGRINPGQLKIVREIITDGATAADTDIALFAGPRGDYTIVRNANGTYTVTDNVLTPIVIFDPLAGVGVPDALLADEGTDTVSNIEILRFTNRDADGREVGFTDVFIGQSPATGAPVIVDANAGTPTEGSALTVDTASIQDQNGLGAFSYQWQSAPVGTPANGTWGTITGANSATFTPGAAQVGQSLRVVVTFLDGVGNSERLVSSATGGVGDLVNGGNSANAPSVISHTPASTATTTTGGIDTLTLTPFDDVASGLGGADVISGLAGNDTLNGGGAGDTLTGGAGADIVNGDGGNDTLIGTVGDGDDRYDGGTGVDTYDVSAATAGVTITVAGGVVTSVGADTGTDTLVAVENFVGTQGNDNITVNGNANVIDGQDGNDTINSGGGADVVDGGAGSDFLDGAAGADTLNGGSGGDILVGGAGSDTIDVGLANDNASDIIRFLNANEFGDSVVNFDVTGSTAQTDKVQFGGALNTALDDGNNNDQFLFASGNNGAGTVSVTVGQGDGDVEALYLSGIGGEGVNSGALGNAGAVAAAFNAEFNITAANGEDALLVINDTNGSNFAVWRWTQAGGGEVSAGELTLISQFQANGTATVDQFVLF